MSTRRRTGRFAAATLAAATLAGAAITSGGTAGAKPDRTPPGQAAKGTDARPGGEAAAPGAPRRANAPSPDGLGEFSIGHTELQLTDPARALDGSTPADGEGRYLHLDVWYPTDVEATGRITYDWNNPLYNQNPGGSVWPGLPDLAPMTWEGATSLNPIAEGAPIATGEHPLLIASHGNLVSSAKNMPDTLETLASHGYVVLSVEHTGNDDAWYQADWLGRRLGLPIGPNPSTQAAGNIAVRSADVGFVIDAALAGDVDRAGGLDLRANVDPEAIGVLGFSLGGMTSLATVTGIDAAGTAPDPRVRAALMVGGTNYGLLLDEDDYASATVPLMFLGNDTGIAYDAFDEFTGTREKHLVDVADFNHHVGGYQSSWCRDFESSMEAVDPSVFPGVFGDAGAYDPSDVAGYIFDATFYFVYTGARESGIYDYCEPSVFDDVTDEQLTAVLFGDPSIVDVRDELIGSMPLKPEASIEELTRVTNRYAVSFFDSTIGGDRSAKRYLNPSAASARDNPLVRYVEGCQRVPDRPFDLVAGDTLTFTPVDGGYEVELTSGGSLLDAGTDVLAVAPDTVAELDLGGFSFPAPGFADPIDTLIVNENGVVSTLTAPDIGGIDDNGSPWYVRGHLLLSAQFTIAALMKDLDASAPGAAVLADVADDRVVITWRDVPAAGTTEPNTLQVVIDADGTISMIVGELAGTGAAYSPSILGTLGIAGGGTSIDDLDAVGPTDLSALADGPTFVPFDRGSAIYEQYVEDVGSSCGGGRR